MRYVLAVLCLAALLAAAVGALGTGRRGWGVALLAVSAAWLPLNGGELEGPVLWTVSASHGLTLADLLGLAGAALAGLTIWPPHRWRSARWVAARVVVVGLVVAAGFGVAAVDTDQRVAADRHERASARPAGSAPAPTLPALAQWAPTPRTDPTQVGG